MSAQFGFDALWFTASPRDDIELSRCVGCDWLCLGAGVAALVVFLGGVADDDDDEPLLDEPDPESESESEELLLLLEDEELDELEELESLSDPAASCFISSSRSAIVFLPSSSSGLSV